MKGDSDNNSTLGISLYKLYYNDLDFQVYFANESSYVDFNYERKFIDIKI